MDQNLENPAEHGINPNLENALQQGINHYLRDATAPGSIDALYALIREDATAFDNIDAIPFVQTPLHEVASAGHTRLAMEIMRLKPSFARKLNKDGFTPMHLALQNGETRVVLLLLDVDKHLVCIQGQEGITPLHYAAQIGHLDLLVAFLRVCPESIDHLTIRRESVLLIALANNRFDPFQLLLGWLRRACFKDAFLMGIKL
ncbi:ankyrin repeat-containing protein BDA1-like [Corylus avellana]|uniref:ankyrin repeat-containing protein BDA1-like n=1 Tax=Corylus avellana TaxID=13451 RepID=UPI001E2088C5|nr:ankyrin repeat-containing protein BDA1-like [Corylus avellana]